jgi:hypothetical protein
MGCQRKDLRSGQRKTWENDASRNAATTQRKQNLITGVSASHGYSRRAVASSRETGFSGFAFLRVGVVA